MVLLDSQCLSDSSMVTQCLQHGWVAEEYSSLSPHYHMSSTHLMVLSCSQTETLLFPHGLPMHPSCRLPYYVTSASMCLWKVAANHRQHPSPTCSMAWKC